MYRLILDGLRTRRRGRLEMGGGFQGKEKGFALGFFDLDCQISHLRLVSELFPSISVEMKTEMSRYLVSSKSRI